MAIIRRHKSTVYGLQTDLDNLNSADTSEAGLRAQADTTLQNNIDAEATARSTAVTTINGRLDTNESDIDTLESSMSIVNGNASTAGSIAKAQADANAYTDSAVSGLASTTYVDTAEADAITSANAYTNTRETAITSAYQTYADQAETDAKSYTDTRETAITTAYQTYADTAEADAITSANGYTDTAVSGLASTTYVDTAESDAVSTANTYTDGQISTLSTTVSGKLSKASNLSDLNDVATARTNLGVYSTSEVDTAINDAALAMGTNYDVVDITARDALTGLDVADRVFVADDGDAKWALYKVSTVDGSGSGTAWIKLIDQDALENAISASSIKTAYESNADTNVFTDSEKSQLATNTSDIITINADASTNGSFAFGDAATLTSAQSYTDGRETAITTAYQTYADTAEADAITSANGYTDTRETAITTAYQTYADTAEADAITSANGYTDTRETAITTAYQTYADQAETDAKAYTDTRETAITTAYQSYADTAESDAVTTANSYTDGQISTLGTTVDSKLAKASNLSDLTNVATARTNLGVYSTSEVDSAITTATSNLLTVMSENLVVDGDLITLTNAPSNGVILNFATVRYVDENSNSFDIPVTVTATEGGKEFELNADSTGQFDTKTVKVQYMYVA